jgi:hypothetical protein
MRARLALAVLLALSPACAQAGDAASPPHILEGPDTPEADNSKPGTRAWQVQTIPMPEPVARIYTEGSLADLGTVRVEGVSGAWYYVAECATGLCASLIEAPRAAESLPAGALPDSHVAIGDGRIARAWYADPVQRLGASAIGPWVAGALVIEDRTTRAFRLDLGVDQAFEDLRPRIADFDGDGQPVVLAVRSDAALGAVLIAASLEGEGLVRVLAETPPVGHPGGWINPIGIADVTGTGRRAVALVSSPDDHGQLQIFDYADRSFTRRFSVPGVCNHRAGLPEQDMAVIADFDGDQIADIAVPDGERKSIRILSFAGGKIAEPADIALPAPVATAIAGIKPGPGQRPMLLLGLEDGQLVLLR